VKNNENSLGTQETTELPSEKKLTIRRTYTLIYWLNIETERSSCVFI